MLLTCASVGLNLLLAAQLLRRTPSLPPTPASAVANRAGKSAARAFAAGDSNANAVAEPGATNPAPPFLWSQVESADYRQYIANLRAVGCPEGIIRDIIVADVNQALAPRFAAIWKPQAYQYWRKSSNNQPSEEQEKQHTALARDKTALLQELLGVRIDEQQTVNQVCFAVYGNEQHLLFLPADKREAALQALADADFERKEQELHSHKGYSNAGDQKLLTEALQTLAKVLSPAELEEFRLRGSPTADSLRTELQYFDCTPEEFRQLLDSREKFGKRDLGNLQDQAAASEEVRKLLGEERAKEFERVSDPFYINVRQAAAEQGVPLDRVDEAWQVTREVRAAAVRLTKDNSLSAQERTRQTEALMRPVEAQLVELLGPNAAQGLIRNLRVGCNLKGSP